MNFYSTLGGFCDARQDLQQRALAGTVRPDDADDLPSGDRERHIAQRPDVIDPLRRNALGSG